MTTIVAVQGKNFAVVGVDSRISTMDEGGFVFQTSTMRTGTGKIRQVGRYLLGAAGDVRAINLLHHAFTPPVPPKQGGGILDRFMTVKFVPALRELFDDHGFSRPQTDGSSSHVAEQTSTILAVVNATVYVINSDYSWVSEDSGCYALGTGAAYALGAMAALKSRQVSVTVEKQKVLKALRASSFFDPHTGPPFSLYLQEKT